MAITAHREASNQQTITNGVTTSADNSAIINTYYGAGAVYVFTRTGSAWAQQAYIKAPNAKAGDYFGYSAAVSGNTVVSSAVLESSNQNTITNGATASSDTSLTSAGAAYVFLRQ